MKTLIIAEIGHNHNGDMKIAKKLIHEAKKCGADIAKTQVYNTDELGLTDRTIIEDLRQSEFTEETLTVFKKECDKAKIEFMASVFDVERVNWTEKLNMKRYKIASRSIKNRQLIEKIASTGKDIIASLGMWNLLFFPKIKTEGRVDYLYCVSKYPTRVEDLEMPNFENSKYSGFSDHTIGIDAALVAVARGAKIIEKHFTLDRSMPGCDQAGSIEPAELKEMVKKIRNIDRMLYYGRNRKK